MLRIVDFAGKRDKTSDMGRGTPDIRWAGGRSFLDESDDCVALAGLVGVVGGEINLHLLFFLVVILRIPDIMHHSPNINDQRIHSPKLLAPLLRQLEPMRVLDYALDVLVFGGRIIFLAVHGIADGAVDSGKPLLVLVGISNLSSEKRRVSRWSWGRAEERERRYCARELEEEVSYGEV
jgi:hypothetical protein